MAFRTVFYALQEVFPQVDLRILKAVASQYSSDVDAAVEYVLSDVLPAVTEPTETYHTPYQFNYTGSGPANSGLREQNISLADQKAVDPNLLLEPLTRSKNTFSDNNPFTFGSLYTKNTMAQFAGIQDQTVPNKSKAVGSSSIEPLQMEAGTSSARRLGIFSATENAEQQLKSSAASEDTPDLCNFADNYGLSDLFVSGGGVYPMVQNVGQVLQTSPKAGSTHDLSEPEENYNLSYLFEDFCTTGLPKAEDTQDLSKSEDNYHLSGLFGNFSIAANGGQASRNLLKAEDTQDLSKSEDNYDFSLLFEKNARDLSKSEDNYHLSVLFEKDTQDLSKSEDNYHLSGLFENVSRVDNAGQASGNLQHVGNAHDLYKSQDNFNFSGLFGSLGSIPLIGLEDSSDSQLKAVNNSTPCNSGHNFNLSDLFASARSISLSAQENSEYEFGDKIRGKIPLGTEEENQVGLPIVDSDANVVVSTRSDQLAQINSLKNSISDISNSKETLISSYESTMTKMKEVELQEDNARQVKEASARAHQDYIIMVEDFSQLSESSKKSNHKKALEVQKEKSSLTVLAQELQSRLAKMSAQRDETLAVIEEIKCKLGAQLTIAKEEESAAKQEIAREEELAQKVRKEKEAMLENLAEESRKLQKEEEENNMLREFLLDRGHMLDMLQGEISNVHDDVMALKGRVNGHKLVVRSAPMISTSLTTLTRTEDDEGLLSSGDSTMERNCNEAMLNQELPQVQMVETNADYQAASSDDEWEILDSNQA